MALNTVEIKMCLHLDSAPLIQTAESESKQSPQNGITVKLGLSLPAAPTHTQPGFLLKVEASQIPKI